ncbi:hypothetical protein [Streptomyces sp. NPDC018352]|uniref:hypothetical protein n=1 Tax=Streptomyces sp. NPDC018352 TaxID=3157194 RepID=UPI0033CCC284
MALRAPRRGEAPARGPVDAREGLADRPLGGQVWTVVRGSLLPIPVRAVLACFAFLVCNPVAALVLGELFALSFIVGFGLRRRARRSVRGGVFDKSMVGF